IERCLAKEPEDRYASTRDLARDLATVRDRLSEAATSGSALVPEPLRARGRLRAVFSGLAVVVALAAGLLAGRALWRSSRPPSFHRMTFRNGEVGHARFAPDGQ